MSNLKYTDEALLVASGFTYGMTQETLYKKGKDGRHYYCTLPKMHWYYSSDKGCTLPHSESRLMSRQTFGELFS